MLLNVAIVDESMKYVSMMIRWHHELLEEIIFY